MAFRLRPRIISDEEQKRQDRELLKGLCNETEYYKICDRLRYFCKRNDVNLFQKMDDLGFLPKRYPETIMSVVEYDSVESLRFLLNRYCRVVYCEPSEGLLQLICHTCKHQKHENVKEILEFMKKHNISISKKILYHVYLILEDRWNTEILEVILRYCQPTLIIRSIAPNSDTYRFLQYLSACKLFDIYTMDDLVFYQVKMARLYFKYTPVPFNEIDFVTMYLHPNNRNFFYGIVSEERFFDENSCVF